FEHPGLAEIRSLCADLFSPEAQRVFAKSPNLTKLRWMDASESNESFATSLSRSTTLTELRHLHLESCGLRATALRALITSDVVSKLEGLSLSYNDTIGHTGVEALADSPHLRHLRWLSLGDCGLDKLAMQALADSPNLAGLVYLGAQHNPK